MNMKSSQMTVLVKSGEQAMIICPDCDYSKRLSVAQFRKRKHALKIKCKCGYTFRVELEFRKHYRKDTDLFGICSFDNVRVGGWKVSINNLSLGGISFDLRGGRNLRVGDHGSLTFSLNDRKETVVLKKVIVRSISGNRVGCEFVEDKAYNKALGFFLM
jgi:hypothetical protein